MKKYFIILLQPQTVTPLNVSVYKGKVYLCHDLNYMWSHTFLLLKRSLTIIWKLGYTVKDAVYCLGLVSVVNEMSQTSGIYYLVISTAEDKTKKHVHLKLYNVYKVSTCWCKSNTYTREVVRNVKKIYNTAIDIVP